MKRAVVAFGPWLGFGILCALAWCWAVAVMSL